MWSGCKCTVQAPVCLNNLGCSSIFKKFPSHLAAAVEIKPQILCFLRFQVRCIYSVSFDWPRTVMPVWPRNETWSIDYCSWDASLYDASADSCDDRNESWSVAWVSGENHFWTACGRDAGLAWAQIYQQLNEVLLLLMLVGFFWVFLRAFWNLLQIWSIWKQAVVWHFKKMRTILMSVHSIGRRSSSKAL